MPQGYHAGLLAAMPHALVAVVPIPYLLERFRVSRAPAESGKPQDAQAMGDLSQYIDIILFAMIAGFLVLRLRSVLGRRTGNERRRNPFPGPMAPRVQNLLQVPTPAPNPYAAAAAPGGGAVADGLLAIKRADPAFDSGAFLDGARKAFEMIVGAFAAGDKAALRPLLDDSVYRSFATAIDERVAAKETLETRIARLKSADVVEAGLDGMTAQVTVRFVSDQINVTRAMDGSIVDGNPNQPIEKTDFWSFARDTRAADPNWALVATGSG
jgi:predicted lipid-binding transport protein (Tim44 family)